MSFIGSIKGKLLLLIGVITLLPMLTIGMLGVSSTSSALEESNTQQYKNSLGDKTLAMKSSLSQVAKDLQFVSILPGISGVIRAKESGGFDLKTRTTLAQWQERLTASLQRYQQLNTNYETILFLDKDDKPLLSLSINDEKEVDIELYEEISKLDADDIYFGATRKNGERSSVLIAKGVYQDEKLVGTIAIDLSVTSFFSELFADTSGGYYILDELNNLIYPSSIPEQSSISMTSLNDIIRLNNSEDKVPTGFLSSADTSITPNYNNHLIVSKTLSLNNGKQWRFVATANRDSVLKGANDFKQFFYTVLLIAIAASLGAGAFFALRLTRRMSSTAEQMLSINTDLTKRVKVDKNDELGLMSAAFNEFLQTTHKMVSKVKSSSEHVLKETQELTQVVKDTAQGVERQQKEIDSIAGAITEMVAAVKSVSESAESANNEAQQSINEAKNGKDIVATSTKLIVSFAEQVKNSAETVKQLHADSATIGSVLDVIKTIAEQTNLLALNAAIEAARAGDQGRGFAVVADEVRTLASRTQDSTENIQKIIEGLQSQAAHAANSMEQASLQTEENVNQAQELSNALNTLFDTSQRISELNTQINYASSEQASVAEEMSVNIHNISDVADNTAHSANAMNAQCDRLDQLAKEMARNVQQFIT